MRIIDFHTHAFPDDIARRAISKLEENSNVPAETDGTVAGLIQLMDNCGIEKSLIMSIATKAKQFVPILDWSVAIRTDRIIPFASVYPDSPAIAEEVAAIKAAGLKGIKLHPMYQNFNVDDRRVFPLYEAIEQSGLVLMMHAGFDIAFGDCDAAIPQRFVPVIKAFPKLKMVMAHMGGWKQVAAFIDHAVGMDVYIDTSFTLGYCTEEQISEIFLKHSTDRILFATDTPWGGMKPHLDFVNSWPLSNEVMEKVLYRNAERLLASA